MGDLALVCGAGGSLGAAVVAAFQERGDEVVAVDRARADLTDADAVEALFDSLDAPPRWVVNTAGGYRGGTVAASDLESLHATLKLNLDTVWWTCRAAARRLTPGSAIVNVSSRTAVSGGAGSAAYAVAKGGVLRLTEVLALELAAQEIRVNAVLPAVIDTPQNRAALAPGALATAVAPEEIASVIAFLCSDAAAAVTGAAIPVYGWA